MAPSVLEEMSRPTHGRSPRRARYTRNSLRSEDVMRLPFANAGPSGKNNCCDTLTANMSGVVLGDESPSASNTIPLQTTPIHGPQLANGNNSLMMTTNTLLSSKDALQHLQQQQQQQQHMHMQPGTAAGTSHMHHNMHQHLHHHTGFPARPSPQDELMEGDPSSPFV